MDVNSYSDDEKKKNGEEKNKSNLYLLANEFENPNLNIKKGNHTYCLSWIKQ